MSRLLALVGRHGDDGGRYQIPAQWKQLKLAAWRMDRGNQGPIAVWRTLPNGDLLAYSGDDTRRVTDYLVKADKALRETIGAPYPTAKVSP